MPLTEFTPAFFAELIGRAEVSPRRRQHHNLHSDSSDPLQRLFNAIWPDSYIRPHRHCAAGKPELLLAVRGRLALLRFDDAGRVTGAMAFGTDPADPAGVQLGPGEWHIVVALEPSVLFEVKQGPYRPETAKESAPWSPEEGSAEAAAYLAGLRSSARRLIAGDPSPPQPVPASE